MDRIRLPNQMSLDDFYKLGLAEYQETVQITDANDPFGHLAHEDYFILCRRQRSRYSEALTGLTDEGIGNRYNAIPAFILGESRNGAQVHTGDKLLFITAAVDARSHLLFRQTALTQTNETAFNLLCTIYMIDDVTDTVQRPFPPELRALINSANDAKRRLVIPTSTPLL